jgi:hypothetical protein
MIGVGRKGSVQGYEIKHFDCRKIISARTGSRLVPFGYLSLDKRFHGTDVRLGSKAAVNACL